MKPRSAGRLAAVPGEPGSGEVPDELRARLADYLDRATRALAQDEQERADRRRREAIQKRVVELGTWLALLLGYSVLIGYLNSAALVSSLVDPAAIGRRVGALDEFLRAYAATIPDDLRGLILSVLSALGIIVLRAASLRARSAFGGALFCGAAALSLLGLAAAFTSGTIGILMAVPGFLAVFILLHEFLFFLRETVEEAESAVSGQRRAQPLMKAVTRRLHTARDAVLPGNDPRWTVLFVALPVVAVLAVWAAASTNSRMGFLYWASRSSQLAFLAWCAWACAATPPAIRLPLWSLLVWGAIILTLFTYGPVAVLFAIAVLMVLFANVLITALPERPAPSGPA